MCQCEIICLAQQAGLGLFCYAPGRQDLVCNSDRCKNCACCGADGAEAQAEEGHISDSVPTRFFSCPGAADFKVRGANYLADKKKASRSLRPCHLFDQTRLTRASYNQGPCSLLHAVAVRQTSTLPAALSGLKPDLHQQVLPERPECRLASVNLVVVAEPTFHISRFLPSIRDSPAPLTFVWHVRALLLAAQHKTSLPPFPPWVYRLSACVAGSHCFAASDAPSFGWGAWHAAPSQHGRPSLQQPPAAGACV